MKNKLMVAFGGYIRPICFGVAAATMEYTFYSPWLYFGAAGFTIVLIMIAAIKLREKTVRCLGQCVMVFFAVPVAWRLELDYVWASLVAGGIALLFAALLELVD